MTVGDPKRTVLTRLLSQHRTVLPRPARSFLEALLLDADLLERMHFCAAADRAHLTNSVLISTRDGSCWSVLLGNQPEEARQRPQLALDGLDLTPAEVLERLRQLPVWFLAVDPDQFLPPQGEAIRVERTITRLRRMRPTALRMAALRDQIEAALEERNEEAFRRLGQLLAPPDPA